MKLRIQDNSVRFRITVKELENLGKDGHLETTCTVPGGACLRYGVRVDRAASSGEIRLKPFGVELILASDDYARLADPAQEGVYLECEWTDDAGKKQRCMAFIEKDRPGAACEKPEAWIYEGHHGGDSSVVPIRSKRPK